MARFAAAAATLVFFVLVVLHVMKPKDGAVSAPRWSPTGERIAFADNRDGTWQIYSVRRDGTDLRRLTHDNANDVDPAWSPDGREIVFASGASNPYESAFNPPNTSELHVVYAGGRTRRLTRNGYFEEDPAWSPDGSLIAVGAGRRLRREHLYLVDTEGQFRRVAMRPGNLDVEGPTWAPDGRAVALSVNGSPYSSPPLRSICILDLRNGKVRAVTHSTKWWDSAPDWAPDGQRLVFQRWNFNPYDSVNVIATVPAAGGRPTHLAAGLQPAWSPDGREIAFAHEGDLYVMNADGTHVRRLTRG